jgi:hypothetical protein
MSLALLHKIVMAWSTTQPFHDKSPAITSQVLHNAQQLQYHHSQGNAHEAYLYGTKPQLP